MLRPAISIAVAAVTVSCSAQTFSSIGSAINAATTPPRGEVRGDVFMSDALGVRKHAVVYLPPAYAKDTTRRFPVAYYLHGLSGTERDWLSRASIDDAADSLFARGTPEMISVLPDRDDGLYHTWEAQ